MTDTESIARMHELSRIARELATSDHVMVRITGERIATIIADTLFEMDVTLEDFTTILPPAQRHFTPL